jgi:hypothetical protein
VGVHIGRRSAGGAITAGGLKARRRAPQPASLVKSLHAPPRPGNRHCGKLALDDLTAALEPFRSLVLRDSSSGEVTCAVSQDFDAASVLEMVEYDEVGAYRAATRGTPVDMICCTQSIHGQKPLRNIPPPAQCFEDQKAILAVFLTRSNDGR